MADDVPNVPRCVLKVDVHCCSVCPEKLKKKLLKINGVDAIDIDTKNGLLSVRGIVKPSILIQTISKKIGKKAKIYTYEKNPKIETETRDKGNDGSACNYEEEQKNRTCSFADDKSNDNGKGNKDDQSVRDVVKETVLEGPKKKKNGLAGLFSKKSAFAPRMSGSFGGSRPGSYVRLPPPPLPPAFQRPMPSYRPGQNPQPQIYPYLPQVPYRITKPTQPYPYDFYEDTGPPIGNSVFHTFRGDNVNACSIS